jgi:hypothetical protein
MKCKVYDLFVLMLKQRCEYQYASEHVPVSETPRVQTIFWKLCFLFSITEIQAYPYIQQAWK